LISYLIIERVLSFCSSTAGVQQPTKTTFSKNPVHAAHRRN